MSWPRSIAMMGAAALALAIVAPNADARSKKKDPPAVEESAPLTDEEIAEALGRFTMAVAGGNKEQALTELGAILDDPEQERFHGVATARTGDMLAALDYPYAALTAYAAAINADPDNVGDVVKSALTQADRVQDTALLEQVFAANVGLKVGAEERGKLAYLAARGSFTKGNYSTALAVLALVGTDNPDYGAAQALKGIVQSRQGKHTEALSSLLVAQQLVKDNPERLDLVNLNLARTYYASENFAKAIELYSYVGRESPWWPEAQFERAWAHFRLTDVNGALGILQTHISPFYDGWYYPEAEMLRTYSLFLLCKFPEASKQVDTFQARWTPVRDELSATLGALNPQSAFADARSFIEGEESKLTELVLRPYPDEARFLGAMAAIDAGDKEIEALQARGTPWSAAAIKRIEQRRDDLIEREGERVLGDVQSKIDQLTGMLNDTEITKLDMLRLEKNLYQQAATTGELADVEKKAMRDVRVRKGFVSWPFEGEVWADELGYYRVNAKPECPQGLMTGG